MVITVHTPTLLAHCGRCGTQHAFTGEDIKPVDDKRVHPEGKGHGFECQNCGWPITHGSDDFNIKLPPAPEPIPATVLAETAPPS